MKEKYETPELGILNDDDGINSKPQPYIIFILAGIFLVIVWAGGVYQVAGAVEVYAAVNAATAVVQIDVHS